MMNMDSYSAEYWTKYTVGDKDNNFVRAQVETNLAMDNISKKSITDLKAAGA